MGLTRTLRRALAIVRHVGIVRALTWTVGIAAPTIAGASVRRAIAPRRIVHADGPSTASVGWTATNCGCETNGAGSWRLCIRHGGLSIPAPRFRAVIVCPLASCLLPTVRFAASEDRAREQARAADRRHWQRKHGKHGEHGGSGTGTGVRATA